MTGYCRYRVRDLTIELTAGGMDRGNGERKAGAWGRERGQDDGVVHGVEGERWANDTEREMKKGRRLMAQCM